MNIIQAVNYFYNLVKIAIDIEDITSQKQAMIKLELLPSGASEEQAKEKYNLLDKDSLKKRYKALSLIHHPDKGGSFESFTILSKAYEYLLKELDQNNPYIMGENPHLKHHHRHVDSEELRRKERLQKEVEEIRRRREESLKAAEEKKKKDEEYRQSILENLKKSPLFTGSPVRSSKKHSPILEKEPTIKPELELKPELESRLESKPELKPRMRSLFDPIPPEELKKRML